MRCQGEHRCELNALLLKEGHGEVSLRETAGMPLQKELMGMILCELSSVWGLSMWAPDFVACQGAAPQALDGRSAQ